ncbi:MAG: DUF433 domain-containing protein [Actinobacteria bacterium]|nr:DUF433 domain-containing protein [Actinomycetota bacterium]MBU1493493.1 DUF433 domain-containing protein [Actinomycetota bacterium]
MVVHTLLDNGVALHKIGKAVRSLGETYGLNWPLIGSRLFVTVDGQLGAAEDDRLYDLSEHRYPWQEVLEVSEVRQIALDLKRGGWAVRFLPRLRHIEVDPDKVSGKPSIVGRRIAAEDVAVIARESGYSVLRHDYKLSQSQIDDAVAWWNKVTEYDEAA